MFSRWKALLTLVMGIFDRLYAPELHISSPTSVDSGDIISIRRVNLADLYGFPVGTGRTLLSSFQQAYPHLEEHMLQVVEIHDCPKNSSLGYAVSTIFNDARRAFGQHSPRLEEEIARWLALLHEVGIAFTFMRALSKGFKKSTNPVIGESIWAMIGAQAIVPTWSETHMDIKHSTGDKSASQFRTAPPVRTVRCTFADAKLSWGSHQVKTGDRPVGAGLNVKCPDDQLGNLG